MSLTVNSSASAVSTLLSSMNTSSQQQSGIGGMTSLLSEYNAIRNGSYAKLAKQYYSNGTNGTSKSSKSDELYGQFSTDDKVSITQNKALISDVASFRSAVSAIKSDDTLFEKKTVKDDNGEEKQEYDYDKIHSKLSSFVDKYNDVVNSGAESDNDTVLRNVLNMTNTSSNYKKQLENAGITINSDNTLSIDKDALKEGDMASIKTLFGSTSNFMKQMDAYATNVASQAASDVYSLGGYTSTGAYKQTLESIYNTAI